MIGVVALLILNVIVASLLLTRNKKWKKILSGTLLIISVLAFLFVGRTLQSVDRFINVVSDPGENDQIFTVVVMKDDPLQSVNEVSNIQIGYETTADLAVAGELLPNNVGAAARAYVSYPTLVDSLYRGYERVILFDESFRSIIEMTHPTFLRDTRILTSTNNDYLLKLQEPTQTPETVQMEEGDETTTTLVTPTIETHDATRHPTPNPDDYTVETVEGTETDIAIVTDELTGEEIISEDQTPATYATLPANEVTPPQMGDYQEYTPGVVDGLSPFTIFISGIDTYGGIDSRSRSDVNIAAAVNPQTRQVMLVPIPRDSYVPIAGTGGYMDKITHAGMLGAQSSANTAANLLGVPMDAYVKVNFSTLIYTIDVLGGITVYNPVSFSTSSGYSFPAGNIRLNGAQALAFSRERYAFASGDFARGQNQTRVIQGIINEALKPHNLANAYGLLGSLSGTFRTNVSDGAIRNLIQGQLSSGGGWNVQSYGLSGYGRTGLPSYFLPGYNLSFVVLDQGTVAGASYSLYSILG